MPHTTHLTQLIPHITHLTQVISHTTDLICGRGWLLRGSLKALGSLCGRGWLLRGARGTQSLLKVLCARTRLAVLWQAQFLKDLLRIPRHLFYIAHRSSSPHTTRLPTLIPQYHPSHTTHLTVFAPHYSSHTAQLMPLISQHSHTAHLPPFISCHFHTTHHTPLQSHHSSHSAHQHHSSHSAHHITIHFAPLIMHHSSHTTHLPMHLSHHSSPTFHLTLFVSHRLSYQTIPLGIVAKESLRVPSKKQCFF